MPFSYHKWINNKNSNYFSNHAIANSANLANPAQKNSEISRISKPCLINLNLTLLQNFLGEDWTLYKDNQEALQAWQLLLTERYQIEHGQVPPGFTAITNCACCGDVFVPPELVCGGYVLGCMWCANKAKGLPIPRPDKSF